MSRKWQPIIYLAIKYLRYFCLLFFSQALEHQACVLQGELGECKIRVGTLEKMLAQKELQLLDLQEQRRVFQEARDELKTQHFNALKDARGQAHKMIVSVEVL